MGDEEAKRIILARRARFVAAALAGLNAAMCGGQTDGPGKNPDPSQVDSGTPQPCLKARVDAAGGDSGPDDEDAGSDADAEPQPCLAPPPGGDL